MSALLVILSGISIHLGLGMIKTGAQIMLPEVAKACGDPELSDKLRKNIDQKKLISTAEKLIETKRKGK